MAEKQRKQWQGSALNRFPRTLVECGVLSNGIQAYNSKVHEIKQKRAASVRLLPKEEQCRFNLTCTICSVDAPQCLTNTQELSRNTKMYTHSTCASSAALTPAAHMSRMQQCARLACRFGI